MRKLYFLLILLFTISSSAQTETTDPITKSISEYFKYDRETIHLHLNKNTYVNDESVWFKGYVTEKKTGKPYGNTVNVYVQLLDDAGKILKQSLHFTENSTFEGNIQLNDNLATGTYFIRTYTYFMNNFSEDESTVYRISIVNPTNPKIASPNKINYASAQMELFPESGVFIQDVQNTVAAKITDCNENGIAVANAVIVDSKGNQILAFSTNDSGYGRFDILPKPQEIYKAVFEINGTRHEKILPIASVTGVGLSVNNYVLADKAVIKVKTNWASMSKYAQDLSIVMQNAAASAVIPVVFKNGATDATIVIPTDQFASGITTFYLIDKHQQKLAERVVFTPSETVSTATVSARQIRPDSIVVSGLSTLKMANLSISVLPTLTISDNSGQSMYGTFLFDNVLSSPVKNAAFYSTNQNRKTRYDLDNILITKESKYKWNDLSKNALSEIKYPFESGLSVKGTVNVGNADTKDLRIKMTQFEGDQIVPLNDKNEFIFNNLAAVDSTRIHFTLLRRQKSAPLKMYPQLVNGNRQFNKPLSPKLRFCTIFDDGEELDFPELANTIMLKGVDIEGVKSDTMTYVRRYGNTMARGYKITDDDATSYIDVAGFIQAHGYNISNIGTELTITNRASNSFNGPKTPTIYMDSAPILDINMLRGFSLRDVEEIYFNKRGYGMGSEGANGVIQIYTKKVRSHNSNVAITSQSFLVLNGFQKWRQFTQPKYDNINSKGFRNFGTIHWIPSVNTDANGSFEFAIPNLYQKSVKLQIEGISSNGEIVSEIITLPLR